MEAAALLEEHTPEIFETSIGNIPPKSVVRINITYLHELKADLGDEGLLVTIPTSIAPRYGVPPGGYSNSSSTIESGLQIVIGVNSLEPIKQLPCHTHPISVEIGTSGPPPEALNFDALARQTGKAAFNPNQATARLSDRNAIMDKDFVLIIMIYDASAFHSRALLSPANSFGRAALMVTIKPSELFADISATNNFAGEIIFIADRSGSMEGSKITALRDALCVFLKSVPETCTFNLFSLGSSFSSLWENSMPYTQGNLEIAYSHVSQFQSDMGVRSSYQHLNKFSRSEIRGTNLSRSSSLQMAKSGTRKRLYVLSAKRRRNFLVRFDSSLWE
jgi:hypothetical protein